MLNIKLNKQIQYAYIPNNKRHGETLNVVEQAFELKNKIVQMLNKII